MNPIVLQGCGVSSLQLWYCLIWWYRECYFSMNAGWLLINIPHTLWLDNQLGLVLVSLSRSQGFPRSSFWLLAISNQALEPRCLGRRLVALGYMSVSNRNHPEKSGFETRCMRNCHTRNLAPPHTHTHTKWLQRRLFAMPYKITSFPGLHSLRLASQCPVIHIWHSV